MAKQTVQSSTNDRKNVSTTATKAVSKVDKAREIFKRMYGKKGVERKDIIKVFQDEARLTLKGSSTYFFNIKKEWEEKEL